VHRRPLLTLLALCSLLHAEEATRSAAEKALEKAVQDRMERGKKLYKERAWAKAEREFKRAVALDGSRADGHLQGGHCRYMQEDFEGAIECYAAAIEADPEGAGRAYYARGQARAYLRRHKAALEDFREALRLHPTWGAAHHRRGNALYELDRFGPAMRAYDEAVRLQPKNWAAWMQRAKVSEAMGDFEAAETVYSALIDASPDHGPAYAGRGRCRALLGKRIDAELDFTRAIRERPEDPVPLCRRARVRMLFLDKTRALEDCDAAREVDPLHHYPYYIRGLVRYNYGEFRRARSDFRKAIRKMRAKGGEPDYVQLYVCLVQRRLGNHEEAIADLTAYYESKEKTPDPWYTKVVRFLTGKTDEKTFLASAAAESPKRTREQRCEAYFYAGTMRLVNGDEKTALACFEKSVDSGIIDFIEYETSRIALARAR